MSELVRFSNDPAVFAKAERLFDRVAKRLAAALPAAGIAHVGSTAIPGSLTKGDLDIVVRVSASDFPRAEALLATKFERNIGSFHSHELASFVDASTDPELGVQLVVAGSKLDHFVLWRDRLASDAELRRAYDELKRRFEGQAMDAYREAKARFIAECLHE
jgi:GrpB-like predicted nucleotidyltransferase (UPF0157 family)